MLVGCTDKKPQVVDGLLTGKPCEAPCWNNLTPGKTTEQEVDQFLSHLSEKEWPNKGGAGYPSGCKSYRRSDVNSDVVNKLFDLYVDNGFLVLIDYVPVEQTTLSEIVNKLGDPEYVRPLLIDSPEGPVYTLSIFYPKKGIDFEISTSGFEAGKISPEMKTNSFLFFQPGTMTDYYRMKYSCQLTKQVGPERAKTEIETHILPWTGFGDIQPIEAK